MNILEKLDQAGKIKPPGFVIGSVQYMVLAGSESYGVSSGSSDVDYRGFCIPPKSLLFPHLDGEIPGFGTQKKRFDQWQQHHIQHEEREYDIEIYNIVQFFALAMDSNPDKLDTLFVPDRCVIAMSKIGSMVRVARTMFLSKNAYHRFRGYAHQQLKKAKDKNPQGKRKLIVEKFGWDVKYGYHIVRLADEAEQILTVGHIDLERNKSMMKAVRNGEMPLVEVEKWFYEKERHLERLYNESTVVPYAPDEEAVKQLLLNCLEEYYGSLGNAVAFRSTADKVLSDIKAMIERAGF